MNEVLKTKPRKMTEGQIETIKCAFADLQGAYQAYKQLDLHAHDWKAHMITLEEMIEQFDFLDALEVNE